MILAWASPFKLIWVSKYIFWDEIVSYSFYIIYYTIRVWIEVKLKYEMRYSCSKRVPLCAVQ